MSEHYVRAQLYKLLASIYKIFFPHASITLYTTNTTTYIFRQQKEQVSIVDVVISVDFNPHCQYNQVTKHNQVTGEDSSCNQVQKFC